MKNIKPYAMLNFRSESSLLRFGHGKEKKGASAENFSQILLGCVVDTGVESMYIK